MQLTPYALHGDSDTVDITHCFEWTFDARVHCRERDTARTSIELPIPPNNLLFLSRGQNAAGSVHFIAGATSQDLIKVDIIAKFRAHHRELLDYPRVCTVTRRAGEAGIALFTAPNRSPNRLETVEYEFKIYLPCSRPNTPPIVIHGLETQLPLFAHYIGDLSKIVFDSVSISTSQAPIDSQGLHATHASFKTFNAPIRGVYNMTDSLELQTSNAVVQAMVELKNKSTSWAPFLVVQTSNAPLDLTIFSATRRLETVYHTFTVSATTSNSSLAVAFNTLPFHLCFTGTSSNGPATISLPPTYQGRFHLESTFLRPEVDWDEGLEDPEHLGRSREVRVIKTNNSPIVEGAVRWTNRNDSQPACWGSVHVLTSLSTISLKL